MPVKCVAFATKNEIIKHFFFECRFARAIWGYINIALGLPQSRSIPHMFGSWLQAFGRILGPLVLLGAAATCWSLLVMQK
jgi:hypothetical protein